ncbi:unnamed protein product [Bathycoccus prasinos]
MSKRIQAKKSSLMMTMTCCRYRKAKTALGFALSVRFSVAFVTAWNSSHTLVSEVLMIPAFAIICFSPSSLARGPSSIAALAAEMSSHTLVISACLLEMCSRIYMDFPVNFL